MMPMEPLGPAAVLQSMANALPIHERGDATSDMSTSLDVIALLVHACMVNLGFKLVGFNKDRNIEDECNRHAPHLLARWNRSLSSHGFVYTHHDSSVRFVLHVDRLGGQIEIRGQATGDGHQIRFDISPRDYVLASALPLRITLTPDGDEDRSDLVHKLKALFVSEDRIKELAARFKAHLIQQLHATLPEDADTDDLLRQTAPHPERLPEQTGRRGMPEPSRRPIRQRLRPPPGEHGQPTSADFYPYPAPPSPFPSLSRYGTANTLPAGADFPPPGFDDELELNRPPHGATHRGPAGPGFGGVGRSDLYPAGLGPHDPITGSFAGPLGRYEVGPDGLRRPGGVGGGGGGGGALGGPGGGGMHPTFDDPIFRGGPRGGTGGEGGGDDAFGGQAPPGARWDPLGPGGHPRFGGGRGGGSGSGFGGGFGGFGGDII